MCGAWVSWKKIISSWDTERSRRMRRGRGVWRGRGCPFKTGQSLHGLKMRAKRGHQVTATLDVTFYFPGSGCWASDTHPEYACEWTYVPHLYESTCSDGIESETNLWRKWRGSPERPENPGVRCAPLAHHWRRERGEKNSLLIVNFGKTVLKSNIANSARERIPLPPPMTDSGQRPAQCWFWSWQSSF